MKTAVFLKYEIIAKSSSQFPLQWETFFGRTAPLAVEIGCGNGEYLAAWSRENPEWNFVGIELALTSAERSQFRLFSEKIQNVRLIRDDARFALRELFAEESVAHVMLNFPDPWPKKKHRTRRLIIPEFVDTLSVVLRKGGVFELITDQEWYAEAARKIFRESGVFTAEAIEKNFERRISTKYERKWREEARESYRFLAQKKNCKPIKRLLEDETMPHVILENIVPPGRLFDLKELVVKQDDKVLKVKAVYANPEDQTFLLKSVCADADYKQIVYFLVARHPKGFIVKLDTGLPVYRTPAVKMAVKEIGKILEQ